MSRQNGLPLPQCPPVASVSVDGKGLCRYLTLPNPISLIKYALFAGQSHWAIAQLRTEKNSPTAELQKLGRLNGQSAHRPRLIGLG